jgi:hypothetical protein
MEAGLCLRGTNRRKAGPFRDLRAVRRHTIRMEPRSVSGRKATATHNPGGHRARLRWSRVATLAAVLLIHLGLLAFLLAPPRWHSPIPQALTASSRALLVRLLPARPKPLAASRPRPPRRVHAAPPTRRPSPVVLSTRPATPAVPPAAAHAIDSLIATSPPGYVAGGGRLSGGDYGRQNVRVPGSSEPVRGMPVFRMADPRLQGLAGVIRVVGSVTGAIDPHCLELDRAGGMTTRERIARHVDADTGQLAAAAARYGCPDPLKPGAAMYNFYRQRRDVGAH